ncbi:MULTISPECIES: HAD family hydrolase [unclassified Mumia]|uniref:HAD family hydrolase n=1 Tax=unclassified Mumia TaxID=2621872 RepID=UPI00210375F5|nr:MULTISPECIES: HAD family hydrolase [unclassified Mumia]MDD9348932.1 HAD family hydrolase [Mumia sp.]
MTLTSHTTDGAATTWRPRIVALDVDGTIVDYDNEMTDAVRQAVRATAEAGMHCVISTGRSVSGVMDAVQKLGFTEGLAVASNGSVVFSYDPITILHTVTFDAGPAVRALMAEVPEAAVAVENVGVGFRMNKPFPDGELGGEIAHEPIEDLIAEPVTRVIVRSPDSSAEEFAELAHSLGLEGTNYYVGYTAWLDLAPEGVSKAAGLEHVCAELGVDRADVLAIGDGSNDVEMLEWAGRGVAMGHAPLHVQAVADDVTETVENDGVVRELEKYL